MPGEKTHWRPIVLRLFYDKRPGKENMLLPEENGMYRLVEYNRKRGRI